MLFVFAEIGRDRGRKRGLHYVYGCDPPQTRHLAKGYIHQRKRGQTVRIRCAADSQCHSSYSEYVTRTWSSLSERGFSRMEIDNVDQINPVPLQRSKTTINVPVNRNQGSGSETAPPPQARLNRSITNVGRNPGTQKPLASPMRGLSLRVPKEPSPTPGQRSASPSTSSNRLSCFRPLLGR